MNTILSEINNRITNKKIDIMNKEIHNMNKQNIIMNAEITSINHIYDKLLFKKSPVGSSSNAIHYLKLPR